jgi:two-component system OmpR family response regulator
MFDRSIDVQISRLRRKIEVDPKEPALIKTVRSGGYILAANVVVVGGV